MDPHSSYPRVSRPTRWDTYPSPVYQAFFIYNLQSIHINLSTFPNFLILLLIPSPLPFPFYFRFHRERKGYIAVNFCELKPMQFSGFQRHPDPSLCI